MIKRLFLILTLGSLGCGSVAHAGSIGLNFGTDQGSSSLAAGDAAGVVAAANWNNLSGSGGSDSSLKDGSGVATTASVSWSSPNTWHCNTANNTPNKKLMYGYLDGTGYNSSSPSVTVSNIPYSQYDVYVYLGTDNSDTTGYVYIGATTYYFATMGNGDFSSFVITTDTTGASHPAANYAKFSGLTGSSFTVTTRTDNPGSSSNPAGGILGVQIVNTYVPPAPTGSGSQSFCASDNPTVANLVATGTSIKWYTASSGGSLLSGSTALVNGTHYYASQTVNDIESTARLDVTVTMKAISGTPVVSSPIYAGATSVSGASGEADGTVINVLVDNSSVGTTPVGTGVWTKTGLTALTAGQVVTAKATASGKCVSAASGGVTVEAVVSAPPEFLPPVISGGQLTLNWTGDGELESAPEVAGPWTAVIPTPTSPYSVSIIPGTNQFFRIRSGPPGVASNPVPANGATGISLSASLSWSAGSGATSHDVYFGTSNPPGFKGNQSATTYNPGPLSGSTTYYWRIDEKNARGTTTGTVWSFTTGIALPGAASSPSPANSAVNVSLSASLSWSAGSGATSHDVYFGTSNPPGFIGNQAGTSYNPGGLSTSTTYYWRVDEKNAGGTTTGTVWSFTTVPPAPGAASSPSPADSATGVSVSASLSWSAGSGATSHDVYFGTSNPPGLIGNQAGTTYNPGTLSSSTTYYWRVDEKNSGGTTTGTVWSFTTVNVVAATQIGINFGSDRASLAAGNSAGVVAQVNWNNKSGGSGSGSSLVNNTGSSVTATVTWSCSGNGTWTVPANGTSTADQKLMYGYIDPSTTGGTASATVSSIPYGTYDVYVYFNSNNGPGRQGHASDGTTTYYFQDYGDVAFPGYTITTSSTPGTTPTANYCKFSGRTASSLTITMGPTDGGSGQDAAAGICGIQIVQVSSAPGVASTPSPADGATSVSTTAPLSWAAGSGATSHNVYFGQSNPPAFIGNQSGTTYNPGTLTGDTTYYWRIDEVNGYGTTTGAVWSFTATSLSSDFYSDTWVAVDALGRGLPDYNQTGAPRADRTVGLFYFLTAGTLGPCDTAWDNQGPWDITKILAANPSSPAWGPSPCTFPQAGAAHFWGEPEMGYYLSNDQWVMRKHAYMLANAGVDVIIFDISNAYTYTDRYMAVCSVFEDIRAHGGKTPQICFFANWNADGNVQSVYDNLYSQGLYSDLWFYWKGKPLVVAPLQGASDPAGGTINYSSAVQSFFNFRYAWADTAGQDTWNWIAYYPQAYGWHESSSIPEEISISCGRHPNANPGKGRSFHNNSQPAINQYALTGTEDRGFMFAEEWNRLTQIDPEFVWVTGWNEWTAGRFVIPTSGPYAGNYPFLNGTVGPGGTLFVDAYSQEFSRDVEPMKDGHTDNYYYQMIDGIRRYKGVRTAPTVSAAKTIAIDGNFTDWNGVTPIYRDWAGDAAHRNSTGWGTAGTYVDNAGRNDFVAAKVARDNDYVYFYIQTDANITSYTDPNWMVLLIDADQNNNTGWYGFDYAINLSIGSSTNTTLMSYGGFGWSWNNLDTTIPYRVSGNMMEIRVPRSEIGQGSGSARVALDFKWADNFQSPDNIIRFAVSSDSAPDGRFKYRYDTSPWTQLTYDSFESGFGNYTDGGANCSRYTGCNYAHHGMAAIKIQAGGGDGASFYHTSGLDVSAYSQIKVEFWYYPTGMESGKSFLVDYYNGSSWQTVATYTSGTDFNNDSFYQVNGTKLILTNVLNYGTYTFPTNAKFKFRCNASDPNDDVYIDEVKISAR